MTDSYKQIKQYVVVHHPFDGGLEYKQFSSLDEANVYMKQDYLRAIKEYDETDFYQIMWVGKKEEDNLNMYIKVRKYDTIVYDDWHIIEILVDVPLTDCE